MTTELGRIVAQLATDEHAAGLEALSAWYDARKLRPRAERTRAIEELCAQLGGPRHQIPAHLATMAGAFLEDGADPEPLARAVLAPLMRALHSAARLIDRVATLPEEPEDAPCELFVGTRGFSSSTRDLLKDEDFEAFDAFKSLARWYRPVVAAWSRAPNVLREMQADAALSAALARADDAEGVEWIRMLLAVLFDAPFVLLVPETSSGYEVTLSGCVDAGQLMLLLSDPLDAVLRRIGAAGRAPAEMLEVARGAGPQNGDACYGCDFRLYPWQSMDPSTGLPVDGLHRWTSPHGGGDHSLPPDFVPADVDPIDDVRVLLLVGPNAPARFRFTRELPAARCFAGLRADVHTKALPSTAVETWTRRVKELAPLHRKTPPVES